MVKKTFGKASNIILFLTLILGANPSSAQQQITWHPREDLNLLLPESVKIYETHDTLADGAPLHAVYATIDLRDTNLKLRAAGSNSRRETTRETYDRHNAILAINGGYFSATRSESLLITDGEVIAPGPDRVTRGAFGIVRGEPEVVWPFVIDSIATVFQLPSPSDIDGKQRDLTRMGKPWRPSQAVGGGPVIIKNGKIFDASVQERFGASHLLRHPRTAIGYTNKHTLVMMVVDGRQSFSAGVTILELAELMHGVGCYEAVNLDGGGSSAMVAADEVVNIPVDIPGGNRHSLRRNASALVLTEEIPKPKKKVIIIDTETHQYKETGIWGSTNHVNYYGATPSRSALATGQNRVVFSFAGIPRDSFQLAAWWTVAEQNTTQANWILYHGGSIDTIRVNQRSFTGNGKWNVLGNFVISDGDSLQLIGNAQDGTLTADAIRLVKLGELEELPRRGDLRIAVISDLNSGLGSADYEWQVDSIIRRIPRIWRPDLVLCGGDMVAGMGISDTAKLTRMWSGFEQHIAGPLRTKGIPFAFTIGNHDGLRSYPLERKALAKYWTDPSHQTGLDFVDQTHFPDYYSFRIGDVFFVSWDASSAEIPDNNLNWLTDQLNRAEAKSAAFRIVFGHLPIYSVAQERDSRGNVLNGGDSLRALLRRLNVDVYVSGHQHAYYPGKRAGLQLLNAGAAGSGPRRWLTTDLEPVNTVTIIDLFYNDTIAYTTYDIRHRNPADMQVLDHRTLPSSITGVNGLLIRNDIKLDTKATGVFRPNYPGGPPDNACGIAEAVINEADHTITVTGEFKVNGKLLPGDDATMFCLGKHTEKGRNCIPLKTKTRNKGNGKFYGAFEIDDAMLETLSTGGCHILIRTDKHPEGEVRAQLYPPTNAAPGTPVITSHQSKNIYGVRDVSGLYRISWNKSFDQDGDFVSYTYQLASDSGFHNVIFQENTGRANFLKQAESKWYSLLQAANGTTTTFYHRVIASDGRNISISNPVAFRLRRSDEPLTDFVEVDPPQFRFDGKIDEAPGRGAGALWDNNGNLWLADYGGTLYVALPDGTRADFSPIRSVSVKEQSFDLQSITGIGLDLDGNILIANNRRLLKVNSNTGEGMAVWEVPAGERAIISPRVNEKGEIYAMSLFGDDPNYVLRSRPDSATFEVVRTIQLPGRILARTFDMSSDGLALFFPDPGSPFIQTFTSSDGKRYRRGDDISSTLAGCNALSRIGSKLFAAVRASGVSGSTLHMRDEKEKMMWTLLLPELDGAEARGIAVSPDLKTIIICAWDKGGGFYKYSLVD